MPPILFSFFILFIFNLFYLLIKFKACLHDSKTFEIIGLPFPKLQWVIVYKLFKGKFSFIT